MHLGHQQASEIDAWTLEEFLVNHQELLAFVREWKGLDKESPG
jgi:hypothetical protein